MINLASPLARMIAVFIVETLIARGYIAPSDASQAVDDAVSILGFGAMVVTLLIWQWKAHHTGNNAHIEADISSTTNDEKEIESLRKHVANWIISKFVVTKSPTPPQQ